MPLKEVYSTPERSTAERVLGFVRVFVCVNGGRAPTFGDILCGTGLGVQTLRTTLTQLVAAGRIRSANKNHQGYRLVEPQAADAAPLLPLPLPAIQEVRL